MYRVVMHVLGLVCTVYRVIMYGIQGWNAQCTGLIYSVYIVQGWYGQYTGFFYGQYTGFFCTVYRFDM